MCGPSWTPSVPSGRCCLACRRAGRCASRSRPRIPNAMSRPTRGGIARQIVSAACMWTGARHRATAGGGAGFLALLASFRGAQVTALDASPGLLAIARQRLPGADVREGVLEALPFADASFDAVVAVNSVFYAGDMAAAMRELVRVARSGGRAVVTAWGPPEKCEF